MQRYLCSLAVIVALSVEAIAAPITYQQPLIPPNGTVLGVNTQPPSSQYTTAGATYHYFYAEAGSSITVFGDRLAGHYDMSIGVWQGLYADTNDLAFYTGGFVGFFDDEDLANIAGPYGDPRGVFNAPSTGYYTIGVTNFLSAAGGPPNPYSLTVEGNSNVPEPTSLAVFGMMAAGGAFYGWRRRRSSATSMHG